MPALNWKPGSLRGEIGKQTVAAGSADDVDRGEFSLQYLLEVGDRGGVTRGETFEDEASEERLVAGDVRNGKMAGSCKLVVDARRHVAG